jgi:hypothetical protein
LDVLWFSGSVVFRNALLLCGVCALQYKNSLVLLETGGGVNRDRKVGIGRFGLEIGIKGGKVSRD